MTKMKFKVTNEAYSGPGVLINSEFLNGLKHQSYQLLKLLKF